MRPNTGNKRLDAAIEKELQVNRGGQIWLDCFMSRKSYTEIAPTITTRTFEDNNNFIMEREQIPINTDSEGNAATLNAGYYKYDKQTLTGDTFGTSGTAVAEPLNTMPDGTSGTIKAQYQQSSPANFRRNDALGATGVTCNYHIRKLTPRECFRLMDVADADIDKIQAAGISNSQQYKMAGNSIVVSCLYYIFDRLFINTEQSELTLF